ncbi:hypothetical protein EW145_g4123 [Phellinidium pouzarii]|uniref:Methyltransferase domain-containing protein n=1 Tax=Phellinidium pouzarii TaxID=167371 RepID=A0A4V3XCP7_9AGAM|nr:hypothetical protein EW145_g4123 [Phellinidium pouzarii]
MSPSISAEIPHVPRVFHNYPGANYILPSDEQEIHRLKLQHDVLKAAFDGKVLLAPIKLHTSPFVLDSGTGSAAWLLDVAPDMSPSAIMHGVDIENRLFPTSHPPNISFSINSIATLPEEWTAKFDLVHQRLLLAALRRSEWPKALSQMFRILRPGGYVQLGEAGAWHAGAVTERHADMLHTLFESRELLLEVSSDMSTFLRDAGFVDIRVETRTIPLGAWAGQLGADARDNFMGVYRGMKTPVLRSGGLGFVETEEDFDRLMDELEKEWDETKGAEMKFHIFIAQKPTECTT